MRQRSGPRVSVSRYFKRRRDEDDRGRIGPAAIALTAITLALLAFWLADVRRFWSAEAPVPVERR